MSVSASSVDTSCRMRQDTPVTVYQTLVDENGVQDSSTPLALSIDLSAHISAAFAKFGAQKLHALNHCIFGAIRRLDGAPLLVWRPEADEIVNGELAALQLPPACFQYELLGDLLTVKVHRKYLPVSKCHGDSPFVFTFTLSPGHGCLPSVVVTSRFISASKEPRAGGVKVPPKRKRAPPSSKPIAAPLTENDRLIQAAFPAVVAVHDSYSTTSSSSSGSGSAVPSSGASVYSTYSGSGRGSPVGSTSTAPGAGSKRARATQQDEEQGPEKAKGVRKARRAPPAPLSSAPPPTVAVAVPCVGAEGTSGPGLNLGLPMTLTPMLMGLSAQPSPAPAAMALPWGLPMAALSLLHGQGHAGMQDLMYFDHDEEEQGEGDMAGWAHASTSEDRSSPHSLASASSSLPWSEGGQGALACVRRASFDLGPGMAMEDGEGEAHMAWPL